jgi:hypothetical protein
MITAVFVTRAPALSPDLAASAAARTECFSSTTATELVLTVASFVAHSSFHTINLYCTCVVTCIACVALQW